MEIHEIIQQRIAKLEALKAKGVAVYSRPEAARADIGRELETFEEGKKKKCYHWQ